MDKFDWILFLVFLQVLISLGILVLLVLFWLFLQGYAAAGTHASLFHLYTEVSHVFSFPGIHCRL